MPKYTVLYGSIKQADGTKARPGDTVELTVAIAERMINIKHPKLAPVKETKAPAKKKTKKKEDKSTDTTKQDKTKITTK